MDVCWVIAAPLAPGGTAYIVSKAQTSQSLFCAEAFAYFQAEIYKYHQI